jgi:type IV pilus assembly protein PilW
MKTRTSGFTLVELMVAMAIAAVTAVIVLEVLTTFQSRRQSVSGSNDAEINASIGMFAIEREIRMAGAGYTSAIGSRCVAGINLAYNGAAVSNGAQPMPLRIIDGGANPDRIDMMRSDANLGVAPITVMQAMASPVANIVVSSSAGLAVNDLLLAVSNDSSQPCTLMQLTAAPAAVGVNWSLAHDSTSLYNPASPAVLFTNAAAYQPQDSIINLGGFGVRRFQVVCSDGGAPAPTNSCDLKWFDPITQPAPTMGNTESAASQVVDLQAQYGVAPAGSQVVDQWVDATGVWAGIPNAVNVARIKAVRVAIVTRSNREGRQVGPASVALWDAGIPATERLRNFAGDERNFRYQVLTVTIPLINVIWSGV